MKHHVHILLIAVAILVLLKIFGPVPLSINSVVTNKSNVFSVSGEGSITAVPDTATINLGIVVSKSTVKETQTTANSIINKIQDDLKKLGIPDKNIKTISYNLNPSYDWTSSIRKITGYQINTNLEVKVTDFEKINQVIDTATADGANLVGNLQFSVNDDKLKDLQKQAREEAVKQAKEKAQDLANVSGLKLGKLIDVQESSNPLIRPMVYDLAVTGKDTTPAETQVAPGEQEIKSSITLSYETL